jgi:FkbM family methyltransferase
VFDYLKTFIKTKPRLYDFLNARRPIGGDIIGWLHNFSSSNHGRLKFIQVGANDGLRWDPLRRFVLRDNWEGVFVEPILPVFNLLVANYAYANKGQLKFENCVISNDTASLDFYSYSQAFLDSLPLEQQLYYQRRSSLDKQLVVKTLKERQQSIDHITCYRTPSKKLSELIEKHFCEERVDLIFVDAEGHDDEVIRTIDFSKCKPRAIVYESHSLGDKKLPLENLLITQGYILQRHRGDTVAELQPKITSTK